MTTATQTKKLTSVAKRAIAMLDPDWQVTAELKALLAECSLVAASKPASKGRKISKKAQPYRPIENTIKHVEPKGTVKILGEKSGQWQGSSQWTLTRSNDCQCAGCVIAAGFQTRTREGYQIENSNKEHFDRDALAAKLTICQCGHHADKHDKDELESLLECQETGCECDHFRTPTLENVEN